MKTITELCHTLPRFDEVAAAEARARWDSLAKPPGSLGLLEKVVVRLAGITATATPAIGRRVLLVCCADNGVARQKVSQADASVTVALARALAEGQLCTCKMASLAGVHVMGIDMGMNEEVPALCNRRVAAGTADMSLGPAMTREEALTAIDHGYALARDCQARGYSLVATGEVGIGNTTTSSAIAAILLGRPPSAVTGRGAGLCSAGVGKKVAIIERAIAVNGPDPVDPLDILAKLGGFDIAAMVGIYLGCAAHRLPVLVDGLISSVAALLAKRLCPLAGYSMIASHVSAEPASVWLLEALELEPMITAGLCLGEGSGCIAAIPLLDMALKVYNDMIPLSALVMGENNNG